MWTNPVSVRCDTQVQQANREDVICSCYAVLKRDEIKKASLRTKSHMKMQNNVKGPGNSNSGSVPFYFKPFLPIKEMPFIKAKINSNSMSYNK